MSYTNVANQLLRCISLVLVVFLVSPYLRRELAFALTLAIGNVASQHDYHLLTSIVAFWTSSVASLRLLLSGLSEFVSKLFRNSTFIVSMEIAILLIFAFTLISAVILYLQRSASLPFAKILPTAELPNYNYGSYLSPNMDLRKVIHQ